MSNQFTNYIPVQDLPSTTDVIEGEESMSESVAESADLSEGSETISETVTVNVT